MRKTVVALCVLVLFSSGSAFASGLAIPEQGAAALGLSAAMTARNEDLSAIFYNPAGLDYVENFELYLGITPIMPLHEYSPFPKDRLNFDSVSAEKNIYLPPQIYAAWRATSHVVLGVGLYAPFGLGTEWKDDWAGRYTSTFGEITTVYINPTVAINVTDKFSFGFGASYIRSDATIEKMIDTGASVGLGTNPKYDTKFGLEGDGSTFGYNAGLLYRPVETIQLGVSYRSAYDIDYEGDAKFKHKGVFDAMPGGVHPVTGDPMSLYQALSLKMPSSQSGEATLSMPWMLNFGAKFDLTERLDTSVDVDLVGWDRYEKLEIDFDEDLPSDTSVMRKDWDNSFVLRGGATYDVNDKLIARGGFLYDNNPVPDETMDGQLPDADRFGLSVGCGYSFGKIRVDAGYLLLFFANREKDNGIGFGADTTGDGKINRFDIPNGYPVGNGDYDSRAHLWSIGASMAF